MRDLLWIPVLCVFVMMSGGVFTQEPTPALKPTRVAVINLERVAQESIVGKQIFRELQTLRQKQAQQLQKMENELREMEKQFQEQRAVLSPEALQEIISNVRRKRREIDRFREDADAEFQERVTVLQARFARQVEPIIVEVCKEKGIDLVLRVELVAFYTRAIDITDEVIRRFNQKAAQASTPKQGPGG